MKKVFYCMPGLIYCAAILTLGMILGFDGSWKPVTWVYLLLFISAAVLLCKNKWWGSIPGAAVGAIIICLFYHDHVHHHINETPIGLGVMIYFLLMGLLCHKTTKT